MRAGTVALTIGRFTAAAAIAVLVLPACGPANTTAHEPNADRDHGHAKAEKVGLSWTLGGLTPASEVKAVTGGFALYALHDGLPEVLGLDARTGRPRWRYPATPSFSIPSVGLWLAARGGTVVYLAPRGAYRDGVADVVAVDAISGRRQWVFRPGKGLVVVEQPDWCGAGRSEICLMTARKDFSQTRLVVLRPADGRPLLRRAAGDGRLLGDDLYSAGTDLLRITPDGRQWWRRPITKTWGRDLSADGGWDVRLVGRRYIGWLGHSLSPSGEIRPFAGGIAAVDAASGRRLWSRMGGTAYCGALTFDPRHPVWCRSSAGLHEGRRAGPRDDVTVEGLDPATGRTRWSWHAGAMRGLTDTDTTVIQVSTTSYVLRTPHGLLQLDLDHGVHALTGAAPTGWCRDDAPVRPVRRIPVIGGDAYDTTHTWPCDAHGVTLRLPATLPDFAGARSGPFFAWVTRNTVQAVTVE